MGASSDNLDEIGRLHAGGFVPARGLIADIGCQQLWDGTVDRVRGFLDHFGIEPPTPDLERLSRRGTFITEHLELAGFRYRSFDIVEAPKCEFFDLNLDRVPRRWRGKFDLVLNFGTTEHVMNQFNAFRAIHDFTKPGGVIYSFFIRGSHMDHGLLHYSDRFVGLLCAANRYEIIFKNDADQQDNHCTWIAMRKTSAAQFAAPIDVQEGEGLPQPMKPPSAFRAWIEGRRS